MRKTAIALVVLALATPAAAQLLPRLPGLPQLPVDVPGAIGDVQRTVPSTLRDVTDLRRLRLQALVRQNRRFIDVDEAGQPVVRGEVLAISPSARSLERVRKAGFSILREERLEAVGITLVTLSAPPGVSAREAVRRLRRTDPEGKYDFNHIYTGAGAVGGASAMAAAGSSGGAGGRIGLIDTGVEEDHPALKGVRIEQRGFAPGGVRPMPHGTATASLLAGRSGAFRGAAPGSSLLVADVYGTGPTGGSADALVRALGWMAQERVPVVNVSLVGPQNASLRAVVRALSGQGTLVVAAVGNDGPAAPPLYPASYPEAVAVTGVDDRGKVLLEATRSPGTDFAAPGADMAAASTGGIFVGVRGTSFAAPIVAGMLAALMEGRSPAAAQSALDALARQAKDVGPKGADKTYGRGLVGEDLRVSLKAVGAR